MTGWVNPQGAVNSSGCVFISKANEFSPSGSCIGVNQAVVGTGTTVRDITAADIPSGIYWEGSGNPLGTVNAEEQNTSNNQQDQTSDSSQAQADSAANAGLPEFGAFGDFLQQEAIEGIPNWMFAVLGGMFLFRKQLL